MGGVELVQKLWHENYDTREKTIYYRNMVENKDCGLLLINFNNCAYYFFVLKWFLWAYVLYAGWFSLVFRWKQYIAMKEKYICINLIHYDKLNRDFP